MGRGGRLIVALLLLVAVVGGMLQCAQRAAKHRAHGSAARPAAQP